MQLPAGLKLVLFTCLVSAFNATLKRLFNILHSMRESVEIHYSAIIGSFLSGGPMLKNKGWPWIPSRCIRRRLGLREHRMQPAREKGCEHVFDLMRRRTPPIFVFIYAHTYTDQNYAFFQWKCVFCCEWQSDARDAFGEIHFLLHNPNTHERAPQRPNAHTGGLNTFFRCADRIVIRIIIYLIIRCKLG
jgi:hypothetical protein